MSGRPAARFHQVERGGVEGDGIGGDEHADIGDDLLVAAHAVAVLADAGQKIDVQGLALLGDGHAPGVLDDLALQLLVGRRPVVADGVEAADGEAFGAADAGELVDLGARSPPW